MSKGPITLRESIVTLIDYACEQGGAERPHIARAIKRLRAKAEDLREQHERRRAPQQCPACGACCSRLLCWKCWMKLPEAMREMYDGARTDEGKQAAARVIMEFGASNRSAIRDLQSAIT